MHSYTIIPSLQQSYAQIGKKEKYKCILNPHDCDLIICQFPKDVMLVVETENDGILKSIQIVVGILYSYVNLFVVVVFNHLHVNP